MSGLVAAGGGAALLTLRVRLANTRRGASAGDPGAAEDVEPIADSPDAYTARTGDSPHDLEASPLPSAFLTTPGAPFLV